MTIEAVRLVEKLQRSEKVGQVDKAIRKKRCKRKVRIQLRRPISALQELFDSCKHVFKGPSTRGGHGTGRTGYL
ncbi:hypothetical protein CASFOL_012063 [Castilleja foliolosa]|uniref:Ribosomal protein S15 n=1 Tax=Castilleja foliolosa TaxID=1961234 RepID=A0ABD3DQZ5_9LAMI